MTFNAQRYTLIFIAALIGLVVITRVIAMVFGLDLQNAGMALIPPMIAALVEGQKHAQATREPIANIWKQAGLMTAISVAIITVLSAIILASHTQIRVMSLSHIRELIAAFAIFALIWLLVNRFFFSMGAKGVWKAQDRGQ